MSSTATWSQARSLFHTWRPLWAQETYLFESFLANCAGGNKLWVRLLWCVINQAVMMQQRLATWRMIWSLCLFLCLSISDYLRTIALDEFFLEFFPELSLHRTLMIAQRLASEPVIAVSPSISLSLCSRAWHYGGGLSRGWGTLCREKKYRVSH